MRGKFNKASRSDSVEGKIPPVLEIIGGSVPREGGWPSTMKFLKLSFYIQRKVLNGPDIKCSMESRDSSMDYHDLEGAG